MRRYKKNREVSDIDSLFSFADKEPMSCQDPTLIIDSFKNQSYNVVNSSRLTTFENFPDDAISYNRGMVITSLFKI